MNSHKSESDCLCKRNEAQQETTLERLPMGEKHE